MGTICTRGIVIRTTTEKTFHSTRLKETTKYNIDENKSSTNFLVTMLPKPDQQVQKKSLDKRQNEDNDEFSYINNGEMDSGTTDTGNPLIPALVLDSYLYHFPKISKSNHPELPPLNPYISLLLSHYGRYVPLRKLYGRGIYGYSAANNYHNNKPFGAYKVYENE